MKKIIVLLLYFCHMNAPFAQGNVNVYVWGGEIPKILIQKFERETGIKVSFSTYDSNETLYAKLKAGGQGIYDVVLPSAYFVERMQRQNMLQALDQSRLPNARHLSPRFKNNEYDPHNQYSMPIIWGATGLFYSNDKDHLNQWNTFWEVKFRKQVLLLDDAREVFSMALLSLGYSPNDTSAIHIEEAYTHLKALIPNVKLFASDNIQSIIIDGDARIGMAWNGDIYKAQKENDHLRFSYPEEGFVIWVDCLAIPKNAPHLNEAYQFINFILRPDISKDIALKEGHAITNGSALALLPESIRNNPLIYPAEEILKTGYVQRDVPDDVLQLYAEYWQKLKLSF